MKKVIWTFEGKLKVSENWVEDGFDLTSERLQRILEDAFRRELGFASEDEVEVTSTVNEAPLFRTMKRLQG